MESLARLCYLYEIAQKKIQSSVERFMLRFSFLFSESTFAIKNRNREKIFEGFGFASLEIPDTVYCHTEISGKYFQFLQYMLFIYSQDLRREENGIKNLKIYEHA